MKDKRQAVSSGGPAALLRIELVERILAFLPTAEARACSQVCRSWRLAVNTSTHLWRRLAATLSPKLSSFSLQQFLECLGLHAHKATSTALTVSSLAQLPVLSQAVALFRAGGQLLELRLEAEWRTAARFDLQCLEGLAALTALEFIGFTGCSCATLPLLPRLELLTLGTDCSDAWNAFQPQQVGQAAASCADLSALQKQPRLNSLSLRGPALEDEFLPLCSQQYAQLAKCTQLQSLSLSVSNFNDMAAQLGLCLSSLPALTQVELSLEDGLPSGVLQCSALRVLEVHDPQVDALPSEGWGCTGLTCLSLSSSQWAESDDVSALLAAFLPRCPSLSALLLECHLNSQAWALLSAHTQLQELTLWDYSAKGTIPDSLTQLTNLRRLRLGVTDMPQLPDPVRRLSRLTCLLMEHVALADLPSGPYLSNLQACELTWCKRLIMVPPALAGATALHTLCLSYPPVSNRCVDTLLSLPCLRRLYIKPLFSRDAALKLPESRLALQRLRREAPARLTLTEDRYLWNLEERRE